MEITTIGGFPAKKVSIIALVVLLIHSVLNLLGYYQAGYQLASPLIPQGLIDKIATPYLKIPSLYVGSWSEWSRNDKPIATGE